MHSMKWLLVSCLIHVLSAQILLGGQNDNIGFPEGLQHCTNTCDSGHDCMTIDTVVGVSCHGRGKKFCVREINRVYRCVKKFKGDPFSHVHAAFPPATCLPKCPESKTCKLKDEMKTYPDCHAGLWDKEEDCPIVAEKIAACM